ncbi:uncharacterized protein LY89DRAFT_737525 [Mollisia scopiformis]|uniref:Uncharacterized protein n=1 Tax=Mollisia scopiformis TaxID=149040 RepID=A0A194X024_MOLSC|nr:uncharacterized protein LY89DRAFT_737525 [Mollisia scopiformis]KUJ13546.1 hypothetical protein LY89DRAFT_737525 [Mollisia scopiformis]
MQWRQHIKKLKVDKITACSERLASASLHRAIKHLKFYEKGSNTTSGVGDNEHGVGALRGDKRAQTMEEVSLKMHMMGSAATESFPRFGKEEFRDATPKGLQ